MGFTYAELPLLKESFIGYLTSQVTTTIDVEPLQDEEINPGELFKITMTATNPPVGIRLAGLVWRVRVTDPDAAMLRVPGDGLQLIAREGRDPSSPELKPDSEVEEMYLTSTGPERQTLDVDDSDTVVCRGIAGETIGAQTRVEFRLYAEPDLEDLFPQHHSLTRSDTVLVEE